MKTSIGNDGLRRCDWSYTTTQYQHYHDNEWGVPVADDHRLYEKICLEGFQCGLSWRTVLEKRARFRQVFADFDFYQVASFDDRQIEKMLEDPGLIRNRRKLEAAVHNAARAIEMVEQEGSLAAFFWAFEPRHDPLSEPQTQTMSAQSQALSRALKKRGWKFVGPTTCYAFMQAMGLLNDHHRDCAFRNRVDASRRAFLRPLSPG